MAVRIKELTKSRYSVNGKLVLLEGDKNFSCSLPLNNDERKAFTSFRSSILGYQINPAIWKVIQVKAQ